MDKNIILIFVFLLMGFLICLIILAFCLWEHCKCTSQESVQTSRRADSENQNVEPHVQAQGSANLNFQVVDEFVNVNSRNESVSSPPTFTSWGLGHIEATTEFRQDQLPSSSNQRQRVLPTPITPISSTSSFEQCQEEEWRQYLKRFHINPTTRKSLRTRPPGTLRALAHENQRTNAGIPLGLTSRGAHGDIFSDEVAESTDIELSQEIIRNQTRPLKKINTFARTNTGISLDLTSPRAHNDILSDTAPGSSDIGLSQEIVRNQTGPLKQINSFDQSKSLVVSPENVKLNPHSIRITKIHTSPSTPVPTLSYSEIAKRIQEPPVRINTNSIKQILKPLRIAVDATPRGIGGYCIDRNKSRIEYYSTSSRSMPWFLWDQSSRGNSSEFEMKNLLCALLLWHPLIVETERVEIYTDNMAISGKNEYGRRVRNFLSHLQDCQGVEVMNLDAMHLRKDKFPRRFENIIGPADLLSRNFKEQFVNNVPGFRGMNYEPIVFTNVLQRVTYWTTNCCTCCGFQIPPTGSFKKPKKHVLSTKHKNKLNRK